MSSKRIPTIWDIEDGKSSRGGFTRARLASWGVPWPPPKGWRKRLEEQARATYGDDGSARPAGRVGGGTDRLVQTLSGPTWYVDSGWTEAEWRVIESAMAKRR